jgi:hypothetical protein
MSSENTTTTSTRRKAGPKSSLNPTNGATVTNLVAAKPAVQKPAKAAPAAKRAGQEVLVFEPFRGNDDQWRAKGARHQYRISHTSDGTSPSSGPAVGPTWRASR